MKSPAITVLSMMLALLVGCSKKAPVGVNGDPSASGNMGLGFGAAVEEADPEAAAHFKAKGWKLVRDSRISDGKSLVYLWVQNPAKSFENITLDAADYAALAKSKTVQVFDLSKVVATDAGIATLAANQTFEGIILGGEELTDAGLKALAGAKNIDDVNLMFAKKITDAGVKELAKLPKLRSLFINYTTLDGSGLAAFAGSPTLRVLTLDSIDGLTDVAATNAAKIPHLDSLTLKSGWDRGKRNLTAAGIQKLVETRLPAKFEFDKTLIDDSLFRTLVAKGWLYGPSEPVSGRQEKPASAAEVKSISLDGSKVTDEGFKAVADCTNLESVFLDKTDIGDGALRQLAACPKLRYLALEKTKVTAAGLAAIAGLPIDHLAMQYQEMTEDSFKAIGKMTKLKELWLSHAKMKPEWLVHLKNLPALKELNLMQAACNNEGAKILATIESLEDITLNNTEVGDEGFAALLKLPKLRALRVDSSKVTRETYLKAKKEFPKISFYYYRFDTQPEAPPAPKPKV